MISGVTAERPVGRDTPSVPSRGPVVRGDSAFGPAFEVELQEARAAGAAVEDAGLYGRSGQRVGRAPASEARDAAVADAAARSVRRTRESEVAAAEDAAAQERRELTVSSADAVIPPARRREIIELADRVASNPEVGPQAADTFKELARLLERVGQYDRAAVAHQLADRNRRALEGETVARDASRPAGAAAER